MRSWAVAHVQALERALRRFRDQPAGTLLSVLVIGVAVMLPLGLYALFTNVSAAAQRVQADPSVNIYLALDASEADARDIEKRARALLGVRAVRFISREAALAEMRRVGSLADLLSGLDRNPLPHAVTFQPASSEPAELDALRAEVGAWPKVGNVMVDFEWARKLKRFATFAERLVMLLGAMLAVAVVFVTGNTIRLQILTQRDEIEVSRLIGATRRFVRRPFLYFGAIQGLLAGLVAILAVWACIAWAGSEVQALTASYGSDFTLRPPDAAAAALVALLSAALGWLGAYFSVSLYLRRHF